MTNHISNATDEGRTKAVITIKAKALNNANNKAVAEEVLKLVSHDDIMRAMENQYMSINCSAIAQYLSRNGFKTSEGLTKWTQAQVSRIIKRIYDEQVKSR